MTSHAGGLWAFMYRIERSGDLLQVEAFIIHLARAEQRRANVTRLLDTLPIRVNVIDAVDSVALTNDEIRLHYVRRQLRPHYPFRLTKNEIACFLSHRRAWQAILDSNLDAGLIMEDDAEPRAGFEASLALAIENIQERGFIRFPFRKGRERGRHLAGDNHISLFEPHCAGLGLVTQLVSRHAAIQLLRATEHFDRPVDATLQMPWATGIFPCSITPGAVAEISNALGGTTLTKRTNVIDKIRHELARPLYRLRIALRARLAKLGRTRQPAAEAFSLIPATKPPATS